MALYSQAIEKYANIGMFFNISMFQPKFRKKRRKNANQDRDNFDNFVDLQAACQAIKKRTFLVAYKPKMRNNCLLPQRARKSVLVSNKANH